MSALLKTCLRAVAADADSLDQDIAGLAAVGAGIHPQRAADGAGDAEEEFHAADTGGRRGLRHALVERGGAGADDIAGRTGLAESPRRQADHHALACRHRARSGWSRRRRRRPAIPSASSSEKIGKIVFVCRRKQHLRRTADAKPCQLRKRLVRQQPPAQFWHRGFEVGRDVGEGHSWPSAFNSPGKA